MERSLVDRLPNLHLQMLGHWLAGELTMLNAYCTNCDEVMEDCSATSRGIQSNPFLTDEDDDSLNDLRDQYFMTLGLREGLRLRVDQLGHIVSCLRRDPSWTPYLYDMLVPDDIRAQHTQHELSTMSRASFYQTEYWKWLHKMQLPQGFPCVACGQFGGRELHHRTGYDAGYGFEQSGDLVPFCSRCHKWATVVSNGGTSLFMIYPPKPTNGHHNGNGVHP